MKFLIVGPSWVGDAVMAQTLYKLIKNSNKDAQIEVLSPNWSMPILERMEEVSRPIISPFNHGELKIKARFDFGKQLREEGYERAIVMTNSLKSSLIPFFAKIPVRTGWLGEMRIGLINDLRAKEMSNYPLMIEQFAKLSVNPNEDLKKSLPYPSLRVDSRNLKEQLVKLGINPEKPSLAICPGAEFGPAKKWPPNYYAEVCNDYLSNSWNVLVFGSLNDEITGNSIQGGIDKELSDHFFNLIGKTSLIDVIDLLSHCKKVVTNDSGLMHIAAAVDTPLVAVYGPSSPQFTPPLIDNHVVLRKFEGFDKIREGSEEHGYHESLIAIKPSEVLEGLDRLNK
ncbi:MAG: lipopolysaccharide heptosyltransferase II [SAR86 cluster bacterium]|nr:lipopolysaccharide heptosyltransferase II [SAR86 cluster bacterium]